MKLTSIHIENFRSFGDETIMLEPYTCIVGPNGAGKSTVLTALDVFFRNTFGSATNLHRLTREDFHQKDTSQPVKITLTFEDLSPEAQQDFKHYYRQERLVVFAQASWNPDEQAAEVKQHGNRLVMADFAPFFKAANEGAKVPALRSIYKSLTAKCTDLPKVSTKADMVDALRAYEESHPELCTPVDATEQFYGWSKGANRLERHVQWVHVPAVKDAASEQQEGSKTALGYILQRTIRASIDFDHQLKEIRDLLEREYGDLVERNKPVLEELQGSIERRLKEWANPNARLDLNWHYDPDKTFSVTEPVARVAIGDEAFIGEVARLGHGMQRGFLVSLLQELALVDTEHTPTLILGFEEPELYQHPPQAQHLANLLETMCADRKRRTQVIATTHCPYFVSGRGFEAVRMARKDGQSGKTLVRSATLQAVAERIAEALKERPKAPTDLMARVQQILQPSQNEMFFAALPVLVEGIEDIAYIAAHLRLSDQWDEFRRLGCHFVVAEGKTNLSRLLAIALELKIPTFVVFDSDAHKQGGEERQENMRDNSCILRLAGYNKADPMPTETLWCKNLVMWKSKIGVVVSEDLGDPVWLAAQERAKEKQGFQKGLRRKNAMLIAATMEELMAEGKQSEILGQLCRAILDYASEIRGVSEA